MRCQGKGKVDRATLPPDPIEIDDAVVLHTRAFAQALQSRISPTMIETAQHPHQLVANLADAVAKDLELIINTPGSPLMALKAKNEMIDRSPNATLVCVECGDDVGDEVDYNTKCGCGTPRYVRAVLSG